MVAEKDGLRLGHPGTISLLWFLGEHDDAVRFRIRKRPEKTGIRNREYRGVDPDPKAQRQDDQRRHAFSSP